MPDRIRVALAGETVHYKLKVTIPMNQSTSDLVCSGPPDQKKIKEWRILFPPETNTRTFNWEITAYNSSYSGEYNCKYKNAEIFWTLLVKGECVVEEEENEGMIVSETSVIHMLSNRNLT